MTPEEFRGYEAARREFERYLAVVIHAAGGSVTVDKGLFLREFELVKDVDLVLDRVIFKAREVNP